MGPGAKSKREEKGVRTTILDFLVTGERIGEEFGDVSRVGRLSFRSGMRRGEVESRFSSRRVGTEQGMLPCLQDKEPEPPRMYKRYQHLHISESRG